MRTYLAGLCAAIVMAASAGTATAAEAPYSAAWARQFGSAAADEARGLTVDTSGNVYLAGYTQGALDANSPNVGGNDAFLAKYNAAGVLQWTRQLGSTSNDYGRSVAVGADGGVYLAGYTYGDLAGRVGSYDAFLAKYDANGVPQWTRQLGTTSAETDYAVTLDGAGGVYITGDTRGAMDGANAGQTDAFLAKYDADGDWQWNRQLGAGGYDYSLAAAAAGTGGIYIAGYSNSPTLEGQTNGGNYDALLARYDADGNLAWTRLLGTFGTDRGYALAVDPAGGVYLAGQTDAAVDGTNAGAEDAFLARYDPNGTRQWARQLGSPVWDRANALTVDGAGGVYVAGETYGDLAGGNIGFADAFLAKYADDGLALWKLQFGTASEDQAHALAAAGPTVVYVAGLTLGQLGPAAYGNTDAFLVKYVPEPTGLALLALAGLALRRRRA